MHLAYLTLVVEGLEVPSEEKTFSPSEVLPGKA